MAISPRLLNALPKGRRLSEDDWRRRHLGIVGLIAVMALALPVAALMRGLSLAQGALDAEPAAIAAVLALVLRGNRSWASACSTFGLMAATAAFVHVSGGVIEAHFLFFVCLGVITLYQEWLPFLLAVGFTVAHHAIMGLLAPAAVYNHDAAVAAPFKWALIHGAFVVAASIANLIAWSANERQVIHDPLTKLANRTLLVERIESVRGRGKQVAILFVDLCGFKKINDSLGHELGDRVLQVIARRLRSATRGCDMVARFGGDEFAVLLVETDQDVARQAAERLIAAVEKPISVGGMQLSVSSSVGIATTDEGTTSSDLLRRADLAMYAAKREAAGGSALRVFTGDMEDEVTEKLGLEADLRLALERDELRLVYQPIVELDAGRLYGFEALLRWIHPIRGVVPPLEFIPVAEETGMIHRLGDWVLETALTQLAEWRALGSDITVTVNVSSLQLGDRSFARRVAAALDAEGLPAGALTLEITESALAGQAEVEAIHELHDLGVRLALDDFGTGYSSLSYLASLPVDVIKIDRSFTKDIPDGPNATLAGALVALGRGLGLTTVVEGVETEPQVDALVVMGATLGQGYLFDKPLSAAAATERLTGVKIPNHPSDAARRRLFALVVDDDEQVADSLRRQLARAGCDVEVERDAASAKRRLRDVVPDVVFCDVGLPGADGWSVVDRIRTDVRLAGTSIVMVTGNDDPALRRRATEHACQFVSKTDLVDEISRALAESVVARAS